MIKLEIKHKAISNIKIIKHTQEIPEMEWVQGASGKYFAEPTGRVGRVMVTAPTEMIFEYCDGTEEVIDNIELMVDGPSIFLLYSIDDTAYMSKQTSYLKVNGKYIIDPYKDGLIGFGG